MVLEIALLHITGNLPHDKWQIRKKGDFLLRKDTMMALSDVLNNKFDELVENCMSSRVIDLNLYQEYDVKRGLRDSTGKGVLTSAITIRK